MRPELYVTAAALTATLQVVLTLAGLLRLRGGLLAAAAGFGLRAAAIRWKLGLPAYRGRR